MNAVYFCNSEQIDLNAISIMGVSVKLGKSPIGYFGTGLKFALATLLRTGHKVALIRDGERIEFSADTEIIRGEEFQRVTMAGERLGFTTQLGRNWEPWQAYRELYCNCLDEGGQIADELPPGNWGTVFVVEGEAIVSCHRNRRDIFLSTSPLNSHSECEIHAGQTQFAFYRGVKAHRHELTALFTYNVKDALELTEDRTIKQAFMVPFYAARAMALVDDEDVIETALLAPRGTFEAGLNYECSSKPSTAFMNACFRLRNNGHVNRSAIKLWEKHAEIRLTYTAAQLDSFEEEQLEAAMVLVRRLGAEIERNDFIVVDGLGKSIYGVVRRSQILIAKATLDMGVRFTASTLYEEWLHKNEGLNDESRALQNILFEKLFAMVERVCAIESRPTVVRAAYPTDEVTKREFVRVAAEDGVALCADDVGGGP